MARNCGPTDAMKPGAKFLRDFAPGFFVSWDAGMVDDLTLDLQDIDGISDDPLVVAKHVRKCGQRAIQIGKPSIAVVDECYGWYLRHFKEVDEQHRREAINLIAAGLQHLLLSDGGGS